MTNFPAFKTISLAKEVESPENPGALEKRVALLPPEVKRLVESGFELSVESGAGDGLAIADRDYRDAGAEIVDHQKVYNNKDLIIKFKGPALSSINLMPEASTLFCMAHFHSFPERAEKLAQAKINVVAMEHIFETPKKFSETIILSKVAMKELLSPLLTQNLVKEKNICFLGYSERMVGAIRRAGNRNPKTLAIYQADVEMDELDYLGQNAIYFYDSKSFRDPNNLLSFLKEKNCILFDLAEFERESGKNAVQEYIQTHEPFEFGMRRIQCLHETGQAGARYGIKLLLSESKKRAEPMQISAVVLGYGNVGMGAIHECYTQGIRKIDILTRRTTKKENISEFLRRADLIVNGAEQAEELRGINFLISKEHAKNVIQKASVVIDLVGGSASNRSPVENVIECTYLTDPFFQTDGVYFSAIWGWPMMGMIKESTARYSKQIFDVLTGTENLGAGLGKLHLGIKNALVCGPFSRD